MTPLRTPVASSSIVRKTVTSPGDSSIRYMPRPLDVWCWSPHHPATFMRAHDAPSCMAGRPPRDCTGVSADELDGPWRVCEARQEDGFTHGRSAECNFEVVQGSAEVTPTRADSTPLEERRL